MKGGGGRGSGGRARQWLLVNCCPASAQGPRSARRSVGSAQETLAPFHQDAKECITYCFSAGPWDVFVVSSHWCLSWLKRTIGVI